MYNSISSDVSQLFLEMGEHSGEISVVIAILISFILSVTVINVLVKGEDSND